MNQIFITIWAVSFVIGIFWLGYFQSRGPEILLDHIASISATWDYNHKIERSVTVLLGRDTDISNLPTYHHKCSEFLSDGYSPGHTVGTGVWPAGKKKVMLPQQRRRRRPGRHPAEQIWKDLPERRTGSRISAIYRGWMSHSELCDWPGRQRIVTARFCENTLWIMNSSNDIILQHAVNKENTCK